MLDLHCHILPGIDDGALDLADSMAMARVGAADGIQTVAATPHIRHDHDVRIPELAGRVAELNDEFRRHDLELEVVSGGEVAETALDGLDEHELRAVSLGGGGWILLEPRPGPLTETLVSAVEQLRRAGLGALIAHPERHVSDDLAERMGELIEAGALVQATAAHLAGGQAQPGMLALARRGLIHVVASDAHSSHGGRPMRLSAGIAALEQIELVRSHLDWIRSEAPAAILRGARPEPPYRPT